MTEQRLPCAVGISVTKIPGQYRLALLFSSISDWQALDGFGLRQILADARRELDVEVIADPVGASGGGASGGLPLAIGSSIGHIKGGDGSLGFFAEERATARRGIVSCSHVLGLADRGVAGDAIVAPSTLHGGRSGDRIATLGSSYPRLSSEGPNVIDCAFAFLGDGVAHDPSSVNGGRLRSTTKQATERLEVSKIGAATGLRNGVVDRIEVDNLPVRYGDIKAFFNDVIQIGAVTSASFAQAGDSGALVYARETLEPVGLLFATSFAGGPHDAGWTWAHPLDRVVKTLAVDLFVG